MEGIAISSFIIILQESLAGLRFVEHNDNDNNDDGGHTHDTFWLYFSQW